MKILVFSDSHRSLSGMLDAVEQESPDLVLHLGDLLCDAEELSYAYPQQRMVSVPGNCDGWTTAPAIKRIQEEGHTILLSHGHLWHVKQGYHLAMLEARKAGADILLFGHTHQPYCQQQEDGLWVMNPGPAHRSYGRITLTETSILCELAQMP